MDEGKISAVESDANPGDFRDDDFRCRRMRADENVRHHSPMQCDRHATLFPFPSPNLDLIRCQQIEVCRGVDFFSNERRVRDAFDI